MKTFLTLGDAVSYEGVKIVWIRGEDPILTIYDDGTETEKVDLSKIRSVSLMNDMMLEKGFVKRNGSASKPEVVVANKDTDASPKDTAEAVDSTVAKFEKRTGKDKPTKELKTPKEARGNQLRASNEKSTKQGEENIREKEIALKKVQHVNRNRKDDIPTKSQTLKYYLLALGVFFVVFFIMRLRRRRRLQRYTV